MGHISHKFPGGATALPQNSEAHPLAASHVVVFQHGVAGLDQVDGAVVADVEGFQPVLVSSFPLSFRYEVVSDLCVVTMRFNSWKSECKSKIIFFTVNE